MPSRLSMAFLLLCTLTACMGEVPPAPTQPGPTVTIDPFASPTFTPFAPAEPGPTLQNEPSSTPEPSQTPGSVPQSLSRYFMDVLLDYEAHSAAVQERIEYRNDTGQPLNALVLAVEPNHWRGCFSLEALLVDQVPADGYVLEGHRLEVPLPVVLPPGMEVTLFLQYRLSLPPADSGHVFGYNAWQTNLVDWYAFIVPYDPQAGWILHEPSGVGEHLVFDPARVEIDLQLAGSFQELIVAGSSPGDMDGPGWYFTGEGMRSFALSISPLYQVETLMAGNVPVFSYFFSGEIVAGRAVLQEVARALTVFQGLFGPYPYSSLGIVESPFYDGMEYDGLFFLSRSFYLEYDGTVLNNLVDIGVHETAHQWWYGAVGNDQALEPWLDEALSTYSEALFYEQVYPDVEAWQAFRVDSFSPGGRVDASIYELDGFRPYANAVYLRGALFLQGLRRLIGEEAFFAFLKDYAGQMAGRRASGQDFFRILDGHTDADLTPLTDRYFQGAYP